MHPFNCVLSYYIVYIFNVLEMMELILIMLEIYLKRKLKTLNKLNLENEGDMIFRQINCEKYMYLVINHI